MKKTPLATTVWQQLIRIERSSHHSVLNACWVLLWFSSITTMLVSSCKKEIAPDQHTNENSSPQQQFRTENRSNFGDASLSSQTVQELRDARAATARYQNIKNALADGYADINVVRPEMGYHYMKSDLVDATFEPTKPEILVYNKNENGKFELVALEYAVPISLSPTTAPAGFTGDTDVWKYDTEFNLWLLHAWVWEYNPAGVFNPTNPNVHVH